MCETCVVTFDVRHFFSIQEPTESITDTIDGSITEYQIRTAGVIVSIDPATCDAKCSGIFDVSQSEEVDVYTVSVIAHNSLPGPGNTTIVGTYSKCRVRKFLTYVPYGMSLSISYIYTA